MASQPRGSLAAFGRAQSRNFTTCAIGVTRRSHLFVPRGTSGALMLSRARGFEWCRASLRRGFAPAPESADCHRPWELGPGGDDASHVPRGTTQTVSAPSAPLMASGSSERVLPPGVRVEAIDPRQKPAVPRGTDPQPKSVRARSSRESSPGRWAGWWPRPRCHRPRSARRRPCRRSRRRRRRVVHRDGGAHRS